MLYNLSMSSGSNPILTPVKFLDQFGLGGKVVVAIVGVAMMSYTIVNIDFESNVALSIIFTTAPIWLPIITFQAFFHEWMDYVQKEYDIYMGRVSFEIKIPQDVFKSPEAMELILIQLHQKANPDNHYETYIDGKYPHVTALEIVSRGGELKFYINSVRKKYKDLAEAQFYAHYPGIELHELDIDYTAEFPWDPEKYSYFALHYGLKKEDGYPIRTYIEFGMDKLPDEEEKIDPMNSLLEFLGSLKPEENMWVQILISANKAYGFKEGSVTKIPDWTVGAKELIKKIIDAAVERAGAETTGNVMQLLTESEKDTIKAIERSIGKNGFNFAVRTMYITKKGHFNPDRMSQMNTTWRAFDDNNRNSIGVRWRTDFDWNWWQDPKGKRAEALKKFELSEYKRRDYHTQSTSLADTKKVMTTEEIATIFHLPGRVASTPSLARIPSKRGEPPPNLPL